MTTAPQTRGTIPDYLREAQARGAVPAGFRVTGLEPLTGGRTGARVTAIRPGYVLKVLPRHTWRVEAMQAPDAGEGPLWLSGATRELPVPVACPTVDVAVHVDNDEWWMLMRDVSDGIRPRGAFMESDERVLVAALARLHARYWAGRNGLDRLPLAPARGVTAALAETVAFVAGRAPASADWVSRCAEDFTPLKALLPAFLEMLGPADADFVLQLASDRSWHQGLDDAAPTLTHGDLRRANIAIAGEQVTLLDWEFAARAPAACDLQWHWFLHFWAYPPDARPPKRVRRCATSTWPSSRRCWGVRSTARSSRARGIWRGCGSCRRSGSAWRTSRIQRRRKRVGAPRMRSRSPAPSWTRELKGPRHVRGTAAPDIRAKGMEPGVPR